MDTSRQPQRENKRENTRDWVAMQLDSKSDPLPGDGLPDFPSSARSSSDTDSAGMDADIVWPSESASQLICSSHIPSTSNLAAPLPSMPPISLKRPRNTSSKWVWAHFKITAVNEPWRNRRNKGKTIIAQDRVIQCNKCDWETRDSIRSGSTGNMEYHLRKHSVFPPVTESPTVSLPNDDQPNIHEFFKKRKLQPTTEELERSIMRWIANAKIPFPAVESFLEIFGKSSLPRLSLISPQTLKRRLEDEFRSQRTQLKEELTATCKSVALSLDIWTSEENFATIGIIGHWLTPDFIYKERALEFAELKGALSGDNLAEIVNDTLIELELQPKLIAITGNHDSHFEDMVTVLQGLLKTQSSNHQFHGLDSYIRCLTNVLSIIVQDILRPLKSGTIEDALDICYQLEKKTRTVRSETALSRLRILAIWISRSPQSLEEWRQTCASMQLPDRRFQHDDQTLAFDDETSDDEASDDKTSWNSTYEMLEVALQAKRQVNRYLHLQSVFPPFTEEDWHRLSQIHRVVLQFQKLSQSVRQKQPQISTARSLYFQLHTLLDQGVDKEGIFADLDDDIAAGVHQALQKYKKYYTLMDNTDMYYTALILDPRVKGDLLLQNLGDKTGQIIVDTIRTSISEKYVIKIVETPAIDSDDYDLGAFMEKCLGPVDPKPAKSDIGDYFTTSRIHWNTAGDPQWLVKWWHARRETMPQMAAAARDYLAIPASGAAVGRLFSQAEHILNQRDSWDVATRDAMDVGTMRMTMLLDGTII